MNIKVTQILLFRQKINLYALVISGLEFVARVGTEQIGKASCEDCRLVFIHPRLTNQLIDCYTIVLSVSTGHPIGNPPALPSMLTLSSSSVRLRIIYPAKG